MWKQRKKDKLTHNPSEYPIKSASVHNNYAHFRNVILSPFAKEQWFAIYEGDRYLGKLDDGDATARTNKARHIKYHK